MIPDDSTNLLPPERLRRLRRDYYLRLAVLVLISLTFLIVAYAALMVPTYLYLARTASTERTHLSAIEASQSSSDQASLTARLAALSNDAATLIALGSTTPAVGLVQELLTVPHTGVTLSSMRYTPAVGKNAGTLDLSGTAATRGALQQYQLALESAPFAAAVDLPVSAYAKDTDIPFAITVTLRP